MLRKIKSLSLAFAALLFVAALPAQAITIGFDPSDQIVGVGDQVSVDVVLSGAAPTDVLNAYNFDITFDDALLAINTVAFHVLGIDTGGGLIAPGTLNVGFSGLFAPANINLLTLTFDTLSAGISPLDINFDDPFSNILIVNFQLADPTIQKGSVTAVPEPAAMLLLSIGLLGAMTSRRKMATQV